MNNNDKRNTAFHLPTYCCYCGKQIRDRADLTAEHLIPISKGGNNSRANKRPCCVRCNGERGNMALDIFLSVLNNKHERSTLDSVTKHRISIMIMNVEHELEYVRAAGSLLYKKGAKRPL